MRPDKSTSLTINKVEIHLALGQKKMPNNFAPSIALGGEWAVKLGGGQWQALNSLNSLQFKANAMRLATSRWMHLIMYASVVTQTEATAYAHIHTQINVFSYFWTYNCEAFFALASCCCCCCAPLCHHLIATANWVAMIGCHSVLSGPTNERPLTIPKRLVVRYIVIASRRVV